MWYVIVSNDLLLIGQLQELAYNFIESIVNKLFHFCYYFVKVKIHDLKNAVVAYKPGTCHEKHICFPFLSFRSDYCLLLFFSVLPNHPILTSIF